MAAFAAEKFGPYGFNFVQIDDGWQDGDAKGPKDKKNGPHKNFTPTTFAFLQQGGTT